MSIYIQLVYWKPFCSTVESSEEEKLAIITSHPDDLMEIGDKIIRGFVNNIITFELAEEILLPVYHHVKDKVLDVVESIDGRRFLMITADSSTIINPTEVSNNVPNGRYKIESH